MAVKGVIQLLKYSP